MDPMLFSDLHTPVMEYLGTVCDELQHLFVREPAKTGRTGILSGIPVIDAVYIREDLT